MLISKLLALQDLNRLYSFEIDNSHSRNFNITFSELRGNRTTFTYYIPDNDDNDSITYKTLILLQKLEGMSAKSKDKFCSRYGKSFLEEVVDYLKNLQLKPRSVPRQVEEYANDWWEGLIIL